MAETVRTVDADCARISKGKRDCLGFVNAAPDEKHPKQTEKRKL